MHILQSWQESLSLFKPSNFKLFLLVSIRAFGLALKTLFLYWGWLILFFWTYDYVIPESISQQLNIDSVLRSILLFLFICCLRPTTPLKNAEYFAKMFGKFWYVILIIIGLYWLDSKLPDLNIIVDSSVYLCFSLVLTLFLLFMVDSDGSIKSVLLSLYRSVKMLVYNLPWFLIIALVFTILEILELGISMYVAQFSDSLAVIVHNLLQGVFYGFHITLLANFYIKRLYDQIELYFVMP